MDPALPTVALFLAPYLVAGVTALCLVVHKGRGISLQALGTAGYYSLLGGAFAPLIAGLAVPLPGWAAVTPFQKNLASAAGIGGGVIAVPKLREFASSVLKTMATNIGGKGTNGDDSNQK